MLRLSWSLWKRGERPFVLPAVDQTDFMELRILRLEFLLDIMMIYFGVLHASMLF